MLLSEALCWNFLLAHTANASRQRFPPTLPSDASNESTEPAGSHKETNS